MKLVLIVVIAGVAIAVWMIVIYNRLVRARQLVREAWSGIDVQLKRRHDLIPNIVAAVQGYSTHERGVLSDVTALRGGALTSGDLAQRAQAESTLTQAFKTVFALAESYPDLKASQVFLSLQESLTAVEGEIQYARRYYNGAARELNILVESFPSSLIAAAFAFQREDYFEIELATERDAPEVKV
jgi:LemA protein